MADNTGYWWEKTLSAVYSLSTGDEPLRTRLHNAWTGSLMRMEYHDKVTDELRKKFSAIEGRFKEDISLLSERDLRTLASDIVSLFVGVSEARS